ncbi:MAG: hypothetical protein OXC67_03240, partial [Flavobacteriaceae bacterium]|nr:hypothetical protein [Flavobacteriaceae bacterium]
MDGQKARSKHHGGSPSTTHRKGRDPSRYGRGGCQHHHESFDPKSQPKKMAQDRKEDEREEPELQAED